MRIRFESIKQQREAQRYEQDRDMLLARRPGRSTTSAESTVRGFYIRWRLKRIYANRVNEQPENPYQPMSRAEFAVRQSAFVDSTESQLDDFITQAQTLLENLTDQHGILKVIDSHRTDQSGN